MVVKSRHMRWRSNATHDATRWCSMTNLNYSTRTPVRRIRDCNSHPKNKESNARPEGSAVQRGRRRVRSHLLRPHGQARVPRDLFQRIQPTLVLRKQRREGAAAPSPSAADSAPPPPSDLPPRVGGRYRCNFHHASRPSDSLVAVVLAGAGAGAAVVVARVTLWAIAGVVLPCLGRLCRGRRTREGRWCVARLCCVLCHMGRPSDGRESLGPTVDACRPNGENGASQHGPLRSRSHAFLVCCTRRLHVQGMCSSYTLWKTCNGNPSSSVSKGSAV